MMNEVLMNLVFMVLLVLGGIFALLLVKKLMASSLVTVTMMTDNGESLVFNHNFSILDSPEAKAAQMTALLKLAEDRRTFVQDRLLQKIREAEEEQKARAAEKKGLAAAK